MILPCIQVPTLPAPFNPYALPGLAAAYDASDINSIKSDASNRVSFFADKSGNSGVMGLVLNGVSGNYGSSPDSAAVSVTGDIDIRAQIAPNAATPAANYALVTKYDGGTQKSFYFGVTTSGDLRFVWSVLGALDIDKNSAAAIPVSNFGTIWVRVTLDVDNGVSGYDLKFWTSPDSVIWTQLGSTITGVGTTSIFDSTTAVNIGRFPSADYFTGIIYRAQIYNGIAGTLAFDANFTAQARGATSFAESSVNAATVTVNTSGATGARIGGARDLFQGTGSAQPLLLPWSGANYGYAPGVSSNYFSTPSAAANQVTGDIQLDVDVALVNWATPNTDVFGKWGSAGSQSYVFRVGNSGFLNLFISTDGTAIKSYTSTAHGLTAGQRAIIRVQLLLNNGSGKSVASFFKSTDNGVTFTSIGSDATNSNVASIFASTTSLQVGGSTGTVTWSNGNFYAARLYNGIGGSLVQVFDASQAAHNATSWASSTGETWTVNQSGAKPAQIVGRTSLLFDGSAYYLKTAAFTLNQPTTVVLVGKQNAWSANHYLFDGNAANGMAMFTETGTPKIVLYAGSAGTDNSDFVVGSNAVVEAVFNNASALLRVNRLASVGGTVGTNNAGGFTLGAAGNGTVLASLQVSKVFIFSTALDTATLDKIAVWCGQRELINV